jgi:2-isopropylmalate synthase
MDPGEKYLPYREKFPLPESFTPSWIRNHPTQAPDLASVCLRDGNQTLKNPMSLDTKIRYFHKLVELGFTQIEIGYPVASSIDALFTRYLVQNPRLLENHGRQIKPQVLVLAKPKMIRETLECLQGASPTIVHVYNSTSDMHRKVLNMTDREVVDMAVSATTLVRELSHKHGIPVQYQYSPESFSGTQIGFALDVCNEVIKAWQPTRENKLILNLPATLEQCEPDEYADRIQYMCENIISRENVIVSVHTHNDRNSAEVAAHFGVRAGAERVEGTLFGFGERSGNTDLVVYALNLLTQRINPGVDFSDIPALRDFWEEHTGLIVPEQHPYAGDNFSKQRSGTHQDTHEKYCNYMRQHGVQIHAHPYLGIDLVDIGRSGDKVVEVTSQSGWPGQRSVLNNECGIHPPTEMKGEIYPLIQNWTERVGGICSAETMMDLFQQEFVNKSGCFEFVNCVTHGDLRETSVVLTVRINGKETTVTDTGVGSIDAAVNALGKLGQDVALSKYSKESLGKDSKAPAMSYIQLTRGEISRFGVGQDSSSELSNVRALISAVNRLIAAEEEALRQRTI